jgi:SAM-dependent methyltransferase
VPGIETRQVDGQTLEGIADESFDAVCSSFGIFLFPDRNAAWKSAFSVLKPNGTLVALSWDDSFVNIQFVNFLKTLVPSTEAASVTEQNNMMFADSFRKEVKDAGFGSVRVYTSRHEFVFTSGQDLLNTMAGNPFLSTAVRHLGNARFLEVFSQFQWDDEVTYGSAQEFLKTPIHFVGEALICIGKKLSSE